MRWKQKTLFVYFLIRREVTQVLPAVKVSHVTRVKAIQDSNRYTAHPAGRMLSHVFEGYVRLTVSLSNIVLSVLEHQA